MGMGGSVLVLFYTATTFLIMGVAWSSCRKERGGGLGVCFMRRRIDHSACFRFHTEKETFLAFIYYEVKKKTEPFS